MTASGERCQNVQPRRQGGWAPIRVALAVDIHRVCTELTFHFPKLAQDAHTKRKEKKTFFLASDSLQFQTVPRAPPSLCSTVSLECDQSGLETHYPEWGAQWILPFHKYADFVYLNIFYDTLCFPKLGHHFNIIGIWYVSCFLRKPSGSFFDSQKPNYLWQYQALWWLLRNQNIAWEHWVQKVRSCVGGGPLLPTSMKGVS